MATVTVLLSILLPLLLVPLLLPTLVRMAQRKNIVDAPNGRKRQQRPVSLMGGMLVVAVMAVSLCSASLYIPLNDLFPAMCMVVFLMMIGLVDDSIDLHWACKLVIQIAVATLLCFAGSYRITSLGEVFGVGTLPLWASYTLSVLVGVVLMNAINFLDGIDGLSAVYGMFVGIVMTLWCVHHGEVSHAVMALILTSSMFAFWIFNGFSERYKIYLGDSGSLVLGLCVYLFLCKLLSHREVGPHLSNGYEMSFVVALTAEPVFDFLRVAFNRIIHGKLPFHPDRSHLHHVLTDVGYSHLTAGALIIGINMIVFASWGLLIEWRASQTMHLLVVSLVALVVVWTPYYAIDYLSRRHPASYHRYQVRVRLHRRVLSRRHARVSRFIDKLPTLIQ